MALNVWTRRLPLAGRRKARDPAGKRAGRGRDRPARRGWVRKGADAELWVGLKQGEGDIRGSDRETLGGRSTIPGAGP